MDTKAPLTRLPSSWRAKSIGETCDLLTGFPFKSSLYDETQGIKVLRGENVSIGFLRWDTIKRWKHSTKGLEKYFLHKDDVVIGMDGSRVGKNRAQIQSSDLPLILAQRVARLRAMGELNQDYLAEIILHKNFEKYVEAVHTGTSIPHISGDQIKDFMITIPPFDEQKAIADILSTFSAKIRINQRMNQVLEAVGAALFRRWFVDFEFPNQEGKPYRSTGGKMQYNKDLQKEIPQGWQVGCIGDVAEVIGGGTPSTKVSSYFTTDGIPWLTPKDLSGFEEKFIAKGATNLTPEGLKNSSAKVMPKGTILFTSRAPIGYIAIALNDIATNQGFKSLVPKGSMKSEYLYQYVKRITPYIQSISSGSTFGEVTGSTMKQIKILIPKLDLLQKFESFMEPINLRIINNSSNSQTLREIRDLLLPKLMSGKIRVPINKEDVEMAVT